MWVWLLALVAIIATWVGGYFLEWSLLLKLALTVGVIVLVIGWYVFRRVRAMLKARALERELLKQAEQQALDVRPDKRGEVLEVQVQMQRALDTLKRSRVGGAGGESALYSLPWYMIIGPPGAGKTTALKHSGLVFPALDPRTGGGLRGIGGTRNCDWWFTNEAILLDTAGRYAVEADDHEEWIQFIDLLRKYRSRKPINGVIVAISVTDLMEATDEQIDQYARRLRERIDEVAGRLHMIIPVYVVFTKVDLVAGFVEYWGDLRKSERAQIWGMTFPLEGAGQRDLGRAFDGEFDLLVDNVHARAVRRVGAEPKAELRQRIYQFPLEFAALKQNLQDFVSTLFQNNNLQDAPILRGVYFSSGTQEGRPIDRVIGGMMRAFNLPSPAEVAPATDGKSYFVTDVFKRVIFPDQSIAARTRGELRRQFLNRLAFMGVALLLAILVVAPSTYTFAQNMSLVSTVKDAAEHAQKLNWNDGNPDFVAKVHKLDDVGKELDQLQDWDENGAPLRLRWGMYAGDSLEEPLRTVYIANLERGFAVPTRTQLEHELSLLSFSGAAHLTSEQYGTYLGRLKAYLEMTQPVRIEIDADDPDNKGEPRALTDAWARALSSTSETDKAVLKPHVRRYVQLVKAGKIPPWTANMDLVTRVRSILKQTSEGDRDFSALVREPNENIDPITRSSIFLGSTFETYVSSKSKPEVVVTGAYQIGGWDGYIRDRIDPNRSQNLSNDGWVLGETETVSRDILDRTLKDLRERYFAAYRNAWADFLKDLDVRTPESNSESLDELTALDETPWPYIKLFQVVADNTKLDAPQAPAVQALLDRAKQNGTISNLLGNDGGAPPPKRWISPVEAAYQPIVDFAIPPPQPGAAVADAPPPPPPMTGLSKYQNDTVAKLIGTLGDMKESKVPTDPKAMGKDFEDAYKATSQLLTSTQSGYTRALVAPLLMNPIRRGYAGVLSDVAGAAGAKWELDVWQKWHDKLEGKYPFADSQTDATLQDFADFFKPNTGTLWAFYKKNLHGSLERDGESFTPLARFEHSILFTPDFLKCYERGAAITDKTFPDAASAPDVPDLPEGVEAPEVPAVPGVGAGKPMVEFDINLHSVSESVSEVTLDIDGVAKSYKNTPQEWLHVQWPASKPKTPGATMRVRGYSSLDEEIDRPGDFGFFRLMDAASKIEPGTEGGRTGGHPTMVVTWKLRSQNAWVRMDVRPKQSDSAFSSYLDKNERMFRNYKCPRVVSAGVR